MASEDRAAIEAQIPHREPFLFVDRVVERGADTIRTEWRVPEGLDLFRGHYPGDPVLPGVIASEFVFQSGALLVCGPDSAGAQAGKLPVLARVKDARFRRVVRPGETLAATVSVTDRMGEVVFLRGAVANAAGEAVLQVSFAVAWKAREA